MIPTQDTMTELLKRVQVNVPFRMLWDRYAEIFLSRGLNPEIGIDAAALDRFSAAEFGKMATRIKDRGLTITLHGPYSDMSAGSIDPQIRAVTRRRFEQLLEAAALFGPKTVVCHAGYDWKRYAYLIEEWLQNSTDMWRWLAQRLNLLGCRLMLENVYESGPAELLPLFENLKPYGVGFCLDTGHQAAFGQAPLSLNILGTKNSNLQKARRLRPWNQQYIPWRLYRARRRQIFRNRKPRVQPPPFAYACGTGLRTRWHPPAP
jgi:hypothetical protein